MIKKTKIKTKDINKTEKKNVITMKKTKKNLKAIFNENKITMTKVKKKKRIIK